MRNTSSILIHPSRLHQLRLIAHATGQRLEREIAITEQIEHFISEEIYKGTISDDIPGLNIERQAGTNGIAQLSIQAGDLAPVVLSLFEADALTGRLFWSAETPDKVPVFDIKPEAGGRWLFGRVGKGFVHVLTDAEGKTAKFTATRAMLSDLHHKICATLSGTTMAELVRRHREAEKNAA